MDINLVDYKNFNRDNLTMKGSSLNYNNKELHMITPSLKISDILDINGITYLLLKFLPKNNCYKFINNISQVDHYLTGADNTYVDTAILKDINGNIYIKTKLDANSIVFDSNHAIINHNTLKTGQTVKCILKFGNTYVSKNKVNYSLTVYQMIVI